MLFFLASGIAVFSLITRRPWLRRYRRRRGHGFLIPLVEGKVELAHALETILGRDSQCLAEGIFRLGRELDPQTAGEDEFVLVLPVNGIGRKAASEGVVESGPQGVHIGIGPLPAMAGILFPGSVAVLEDHIQAAALVTQAVAGSAEIQQLNSTIVGNIDIVRGHVPMDNAFGVHRSQGSNDRFKDALGLRPREAAMLLQVVLEAGALDVIHNEVGRVVLFEVAMHTHDVGVADELRQSFGLVEKTLFPIEEVLLPLAGIGRNRVTVRAGGHSVREILLDSHQTAGLMVLGNVGDAEAALAQHLSENVAPVEYSARRQRHGILVCLGAGFVSAGRTNSRPIRHGLETVVAVPHPPSIPLAVVFRQLQQENRVN